MKSKLTNFLLIFGITLLAAQLLLPKPAETPKTGIILTATKQEYVIPNVPEITVQNYTASSVTFDTCRELEIYKDSQKLTNLPKDFCKSINIAKD